MFQFFIWLNSLALWFKVLCIPPQVVKNRFHRIFLPSHALDTVSSTDMLFCFEVLSKELTKEKVVLLRVHQVSQPFSTRH